MKLRTEKDIMANWIGDGHRPVVSICCITYNHEVYVEDALKGFLSQVTDFPIEILIHDDASTDSTAQIIQEYQKKYPNLIKPIIQVENQFSKGLLMNENFNIPRAKGEYIAFCEGDDFWTDPSKLQRQYNIMEGDNFLSMCAHSVRVSNECKNTRFSSRYSEIKPGVFSINEVVTGHSIPTLSIFCRNILDGFLDIFDKPIKSADKALVFYLLSQGAGYYDDRISGVYRDHDGGVTKSITDIESYVKNYETLVSCSSKIIPDSASKLLNRELAATYLVASKRYMSNSFQLSIFYFFKAIKLSPMALYLLILRKIEI